MKPTLALPPRRSIRGRLSSVLACALAAATLSSACASAGRSGFGAPNLVGSYELTGPFSREGGDPGHPVIVTFLSDQMYETEEVGQIGASPPPRRYQTRGDYLVFSLFRRDDIRVWRREDGLAAEIRGEYVVSTRQQEYCALYRPDGNGGLRCERYAVREIPSYSTWSRAIRIRKIEGSG